MKQPAFQTSSDRRWLMKRRQFDEQSRANSLYFKGKSAFRQFASGCQGLKQHCLEFKSLACDLDHVTRNEFLSTTCLHDAIEPHFTPLDHDFCLAT